MKPKEFYEIMESFVEEDKRWRALKVGDTIYDSSPGGLEMDYFKMKVDSIDVEERKLKAHDVADPKHRKTMSGFITQEEFDKFKY